MINIRVAYSMDNEISEMFLIDREYASCPVGKPQFDMKYHVIDDNGNILPDGEVGEFCFDNPYVRGYINLPEETKKAFVDGMYRTGDLAYIMPDGNIVICGRKNDMIKINGNRIEPAEIESVIHSVAKTERCAVKGFVSDKHRYICAYYTGNTTINEDELREVLKKRLPYYMIPSYFIKLDSLPVNANGKIDRKSLPEPDIKDFVEDYVAPTNEIEKKLCEAMQKVLGAERIGINDDFYEMGGDSLASMELLVESNLKGLDSGCIFRGRTPCNIAKLYTEQMKNIVEGDTACVLYQRDIRDVGEFGGLNVTMVDIKQNKPASQTVLDIQILDGEDGLKFIFEYAASRYESESIERFMALCNNIIKELSENYGSENLNIGQLKKAVMPKKTIFGNIKKLVFYWKQLINQLWKYALYAGLIHLYIFVSFLKS